MPVLTVLAALLAFALLFPVVVRRFIRSVLNRPISDTLAELYVSTKSTTLMQLLYLSIRAATGDVVIRPMGSARPAKGFDDLAFVPAQLARAPLADAEPVELECVIGRRAARPLRMRLPIMISGMAYGLALTRNARLALARGARRAGVALNTGQGPAFPEEIAEAGAYIVQFGRWDWNRDPELLRRADAIEVQVGQGAMPGNAVIASPASVGPEVRRLMRLAPGASPDIHAHLYLESPDRPASLSEVVRYLRSVNPDVPILVKMGAGDDVEADIDVALQAGVDAIVVDGTEGATGNAPITLSDHFGLPSLTALSRAVRHLNLRGARDRVDLILSGGLREPGDFLKAYALGADCVAIATAAMFAIAHRQIAQVFPYYPPTDLVFYRARPQIPLDVEKGASGLVNYLESCRAEMEIALRTLGRRSYRELSPKDLCTLDREIAETTGVRYAWLPPSLAPPAGPEGVGERARESAMRAARTEPAARPADGLAQREAARGGPSR
ncbi:MAG: FMN-binding glutamate synthase family protein [Clostridia bacterium]|nr:FMN-binding glutamate synthase family protein [Clostridia bacterium]